ncbi:hypothetical protein BCR39DRAFT_504886 [Naematelia encephala]|uniref:Uncharacterized protein n=1 Tax=Naematelia encephala TaxID=71784 RepID=A0A1Y2B9U2_9TREE|nr:hypothetical protein BCR39DRAFT_504886 [Naematelia encephala]
MSDTDTGKGPTAYSRDVLNILVRWKIDNAQTRERWRRAATIYEKSLSDTVPDESLQPSSPESIRTLTLGKDESTLNFDHDPSSCRRGSSNREKIPWRQGSMDSDISGTTLVSPMHDDPCSGVQKWILLHMLNGGLHQYGGFSRQGSSDSEPIATTLQDWRVISRPPQSQLLSGSQSQAPLEISDSNASKDTMIGGVYHEAPAEGSSVKSCQAQGGSSRELHPLPPGGQLPKAAQSDKETEPQSFDMCPSTSPSFSIDHLPSSLVTNRSFSSLAAKPITKSPSRTANLRSSVLNAGSVTCFTQSNSTAGTNPRNVSKITKVRQSRTVYTNLRERLKNQDLLDCGDPDLTLEPIQNAYGTILNFMLHTSTYQRNKFHKTARKKEDTIRWLLNRIIEERPEMA